VKWFSSKVFLYSFATTVSVAVAVTLAVLAIADALSVPNVLVATAAALTGSAALAALLGSYRYPLAAAVRSYRTVMGWLALTAVESSLRHAMTGVDCTGILGRGGTVLLRLAVGTTDRTRVGDEYDVYDTANGALWGRVAVVEADGSTSLAEPVDRVNADFWEHLEERMRFDTSPPAVYLVKRLPTELLEMVKAVLDQWR
jgi:hypothetical protein